MFYVKLLYLAFLTIIIDRSFGFGEEETLADISAPGTKPFEQLTQMKC